MMLSDFEKLRLSFRDEALKLPECINLVNKTTEQYITELDYETKAVTEEMNAKIRAMEEFVNPQVTKLNKDYKVKIGKLADRFDKELHRLQKKNAKTKKSIENNENKIKEFRTQSKKPSNKKPCYLREKMERENQANPKKD